MKSGGQIPGNAIAICEMSKTSWKTGNLKMNEDLGNHSKDHLYHLAHFGYLPNSERDKARIHQFGEKKDYQESLQDMLWSRGWIWEEDILIADIEELGKLDASEKNPRRLNAKEVLITPKDGEFAFLVADGSEKLSGRDYELQEPTLWRESTVRRENPSGESHGDREELQPEESKDDAEARKDFWSIQGDFIYHHHIEPRITYVSEDSGDLVSQRGKPRETESMCKRSFTPSNVDSRCKGSSGQGMGKIGEIFGVEPDESQKKERGDRWSKDVGRKSSFCIINGHMSFEKCWIGGKTPKIQGSSCTPRWYCKRWFRILRNIHWTRIFSISDDSRQNHGYHLQIARLRWTSSWRSMSLFPSKNGRCSQIIENSQIGVSRTFGFVYHDTNGQNHGPVWKTQSFLLSGICTVIL